MKAPYYEIEKDESFDDIANILLNDKQALHFVRRRSIFCEGQTSLKISDIEARQMFDNARSKWLKTLNMNFHGWAKYWLICQGFFLIFEYVSTVGGGYR